MSSTTEIKKRFGEMAKRVAQRLEELQDSPNLSVLMEIPAAQCHPLKGERLGEWALSISGNHRMIFVINQDFPPNTDNTDFDTKLITQIKITGTEDYHKR